MSAKELDLLCIGNALVDVFAQGAEGEDYGLDQPVQHIGIEELNGIISKLKDYHAVKTITSGGGAANTAKIAGYLGAKAAFTGAIGSEAGNNGKLFQRELDAAGVKLRLPVKPCPTGLCLTLRAGDKTRIAAAPSAALKLSESDISEEDIKKARVVLIDGFMLSRPGLVRHILALADRHGAVCALDLSSAAIAKESAEDIADFAKRYPLFLFMNEEEAAAHAAGLRLAALNRKDTYLQMISEISKKSKWRFSFRAFAGFVKGKSGEIKEPRPGCPIIVVKLGKRGAICKAGGKKIHAQTKPVDPVDTTGAGDAYSAAFLTAWVWGKSLSECTALGNRAAGLILGATGTYVNEDARIGFARLLNVD